MMKTKIALVLALVMGALVSCDNDNGIKVDDSLIFTYRQWGGYSGLDENLRITEDYTFYSIKYRNMPSSENVEYSSKIRTSHTVWNTLVKSYDLEIFNKIQSGRSWIPLDGTDVMFTASIKGKEYSFFNGYNDEHYQQMQTFFNTMFEQAKYFTNKEIIKKSKDAIVIGKNNLTMDISPKNVPLKTGILKLTIKNNLSYIEFGSDFILAYFDKIEWEPLTLKINFEDIYFSLNANTEKEMNIFLNPELHDFKPGKYKIIKRFYVSELGTEYLSTEFNMQ